MKLGSATKFVEFLDNNRDLIYDDSASGGMWFGKSKSYSFIGLLSMFAGSDGITWDGTEFESINIIDPELWEMVSISKISHKNEDAVLERIMKLKGVEEIVEGVHYEIYDFQWKFMKCHGVGGSTASKVVIDRCKLKNAQPEVSSDVYVMDEVVDNVTETIVEIIDIDEYIRQEIIKDKENLRYVSDIDSIIKVVNEKYQEI